MQGKLLVNKISTEKERDDLPKGFTGFTQIWVKNETGRSELSISQEVIIMKPEIPLMHPWMCMWMWGIEKSACICLWLGKCDLLVKNALTDQFE